MTNKIEKFKLWGDLVTGVFTSEELACELAEKWHCDVEVIEEEPTIFDDQLIYL